MNAAQWTAFVVCWLLLAAAPVIGWVTAQALDELAARRRNRRAQIQSGNMRVRAVVGKHATWFEYEDGTPVWRAAQCSGTPHWEPKPSSTAPAELPKGGASWSRGGTR